jgi:DNA primase
MSKFSDMTVEDTLDYKAILEANGVELERSGEHWWMMQCPFHDDETPSLSVDVRDGSWRCFAGSCLEHGDFGQLLAEIAGDEPVQSVYKTGKSVSELRAAVEKVLLPQKFLGYSWKSFADRFGMIAGTPGEAYCLKRGLSRGTQTAFDLRWGLEGKWDHRVVIPIWSVYNNLISYCGRTVVQGVKPKTRKARTAYDTLFGFSRLVVDNPIPAVIIVEGEFDAMWLQQRDVPAVAQMGTHALTPAQIAILKTWARSVVFAYDGDEAGKVALFGRKATRDKPEIVGNYTRMSQHMPVYYVDLPDGKDPDELSDVEIKNYFGKWMSHVA